MTIHEYIWVSSGLFGSLRVSLTLLESPLGLSWVYLVSLLCLSCVSLVSILCLSCVSLVSLLCISCVSLVSLLCLSCVSCVSRGLSGRIRIYKKTDNPFRFQTDSFKEYPVPFIT